MYNNSEKSAVNFVFDFPLIEGNLTLLNKRRNQQ